MVESVKKGVDVKVWGREGTFRDDMGIVNHKKWV